MPIVANSESHVDVNDRGVLFEGRKQEEEAAMRALVDLRVSEHLR